MPKIKGNRWTNKCKKKTKRSEREIIKTIVFKNYFYWQLITIVNEGLSLTIVYKTTNFTKTVVIGKTLVFEEKIHATLLNVVLHEVVGELTLLNIFLKTTQWIVQMPFRSVSSLC